MDRGFSLVELSIVLVILGLLTGGILAGQSLIRAAELRSVATDTTRYLTASQTFRDKYFALPGDMRNAVKFWDRQAGGTADGVDTTCAALTTAATDQRTCNGDGNGILGTSTHEYFRFWQHLANAGLIEGSYSGISAVAGDTKAVTGTNVPRARLPGGGFMAVYYAPITDPANLTYFVSPMGNLFWLGADSHPNYTANPLLKPEEAWNIDTKMDDGKPAQGMLLVPKASTTCHNNTDASLSEYRLNESGVTCQLLIRSGL